MAAAYRYFNVSSGVPLHRSGDACSRPLPKGEIQKGCRRVAERCKEVSSKGAKSAKFGEIKVGAAKKNWLGGEGPLRA